MSEENEVKETKIKVNADTKPAKEAKPGLGIRIKRWCREFKAELKKVTWSTKKQTLNGTLVVIASVIAVGICIWIFDAVASGVVNALIKIFQG